MSVVLSPGSYASRILAGRESAVTTNRQLWISTANTHRISSGIGSLRCNNYGSSYRACTICWLLEKIIIQIQFPVFLMTRIVKTSVLLSCCLAAICNATLPSSQTHKKLDLVRYGSFTQTATYSIANQLGFFTAYGLNVTYIQTPNSTYAYNTTLSGGYDIFTGAIDNALNLRFNQGRNVTVLGQLDAAADQALVSVPSIKTVADLKGKSLIVDSPVSGFAYVLRKILSLYGLELGTDYTFVVRLHPHLNTHLEFL